VLNNYDNVLNWQYKERNFLISLSNADTVFNIEQRSYTLLPGHFHTIQVQVSMHFFLFCLFRTIPFPISFGYVQDAAQ
jgi:hypothetical protein